MCITYIDTFYFMFWCWWLLHNWIWLLFRALEFKKRIHWGSCLHFASDNGCCRSLHFTTSPSFSTGTDKNRNVVSDNRSASAISTLLTSVFAPTTTWWRCHSSRMCEKESLADKHGSCILLLIYSNSPPESKPVFPKMSINSFNM